MLINNQMNYNSSSWESITSFVAGVFHTTCNVLQLNSLARVTQEIHENYFQLTTKISQ